MKAMVPVKRVVGYNAKVRWIADGSGVNLANVTVSINPFDAMTVEEAIRLKEAGTADEIVAPDWSWSSPGVVDGYRLGDSSASATNLLQIDAPIPPQAPSPAPLFRPNVSSPAHRV